MKRVVMWSCTIVMLSIDTDGTTEPPTEPGVKADLVVILGKRC